MDWAIRVEVDIDTVLVLACFAVPAVLLMLEFPEARGRETQPAIL